MPMSLDMLRPRTSIKVGENSQVQAIISTQVQQRTKICLKVAFSFGGSLWLLRLPMIASSAVTTLPGPPGPFFSSRAQKHVSCVHSDLGPYFFFFFFFTEVVPSAYVHPWGQCMGSSK